MEYNESMPCAPTMQKTLYYYIPTQVKFFGFDGEKTDWIGGIAFHDVVICGCCGDVIEISGLYNEAEEKGFNDPIKVLDWVDINNKIKGE